MRGHLGTRVALVQASPDLHCVRYDHCAAGQAAPGLLNEYRSGALTLETRHDDDLQFSEAQQAYPGCLVTFDTTGKLLVLQGFARRKDIHKRGGPWRSGRTGGRDLGKISDRTLPRLAG